MAQSMRVRRTLARTILKATRWRLTGEVRSLLDLLAQMALPEEVAELTAFVLRPSQRSLNGATLDVNGASYIR